MELKYVLVEGRPYRLVNLLIVLNGIEIYEMNKMENLHIAF